VPENPISKGLKFVERLLPVSKDESRVPLEKRAVDRRRDALAASGEQGYTERLFQRSNAAAESGLGEISLFCGSENASVFDDSEELFEISYIHTR
jgi:hypothetical protein